MLRALSTGSSGYNPASVAITGGTIVGITSLGVNNSSPLAPVHVGARNTNNSIDAQVLVSRVITGTGNSHAFSDSSQFTKGNNDAYNSFDARVNIDGTATYDHYASFQSAPTFGGTATTNSHYGFFSAPAVSAGATIPVLYHLYLSDVANSGTVTTQYGLYIPQLSGAGTNYAVRTVGTTPSWFTGLVTVDGGVQIAATSTKLFANGDVRVDSGHFLYFSNGSGFASPSDGVLRLVDNATTSFNRLQFGGTTSSFPALARDSAGVKVIAADGTTGTFLSGVEQTAPAAPAADGYRLFAQDNGAGKTQLMVIFSSGAAQQLAIQP